MVFDIYTLTAATYRLLISKSKYELGLVSKEEFEHELEIHEEIYDNFMKNINGFAKVIAENERKHNDT